MSTYTVLVCAFCGAEQPQNKETYWALKHVLIHWKIPEDGINGGVFEDILCASCRRKVLAAIENIKSECVLAKAERATQ